MLLDLLNDVVPQPAMKVILRTMLMFLISGTSGRQIGCTASEKQRVGMRLKTDKNNRI